MSISSFRENIVFFKEFIAEIENTGSFCPTSPLAAAALTFPLRASTGQSRKILELGPGTGAVTVKILESLRPGDSLDICEINPRFMAALKEFLADNPNFEKHKDRIKFYECGAQDLPETTCYDLVICALPFLNFPTQLVREIFEKLERLSTPQTIMTSYEYIGLRSLNKTFSKAFGKKRILEIDRFLRQCFAKYNTRVDRIWLNMLPINVYRMQIGSAVYGTHKSNERMLHSGAPYKESASHRLQH